MATNNEEWYSLHPEETQNQSQADSVISDICDEDSSAAIYTELQAEHTELQPESGGEEFSVSDVLSPDRRTTSLKFRADPVGVSEGISHHYRDRSVTGQEGATSYTGYQNMDTSLGEQSLDDVAMNLSHDALQAAILDLSQHECDPLSLTQHRLADNTAAVSQHSIHSEDTETSHLHQNTFPDVSSFKTSSNLYSQSQSLASQNTAAGVSNVERRMSGDLTQHPVESTGSTDLGSRSSGDSESLLFMARSSKDSRPATVIERPLTEGHNQMDSVPTTTAQSVTVGHLHDYTQSSQFDHSIKYGHGLNHRETLGDTLLYADKKPVISSTPQVDKTNRVSDSATTNGKPVRKPAGITSESLQQTLERLAGAQDSESESNTNITKFMKKAGVENYIPAEQRQNIIDDLFDLKSSEEVVPSRSSKSPVMRGATKSPGGFHEMIPDMPSFRRDHESAVKQSRSGSPGQRSLGSQRSRTSEANTKGQESLEQFTLEESSLVRSGSRHSSEGSGSHTSNIAPDLGLSRERTSYDLFAKPSGPATTGTISPQEERSECSSLASLPHPQAPATHPRRHSGSSSDNRDEPPQYKSSDTLLGYDYRDAASHASSESHPQTPRSVTSQREPMGGVNNGLTRDGGQEKVVDDGMSDKSSGSQRSQGSQQSYDNSAGSVVLVLSQQTQNETEKQYTQKRGQTEGKESTKAKSPIKPSQIPRLSLGQSSKKDASYKEEKWASKVTGVLDSVAKRQSLSARVATILATAPPPSSQRSGNTTASSEHSTPVSTRSSSQGLLDSSKMTSGSGIPKQQQQQEVSAASSTLESITPRTDDTLELTPRTDDTIELTPRTDPELTPRTEDFMLAKEAQAVARLLHISKQTAPSASSTDEDRKVSMYTDMSHQQLQQQNRSATTSEDEDVERITGEYRTILKGVTEAVETGEDINVLRAKLTSEEDKFPATDGEKILSKDAQELLEYKNVDDRKMTKKREEEGSVVSDASLDEDVKRILAKYGHKVAAEEADAEEEVASSSRQSPAGSAYETDDTLSHRVQKLLMKPEPRRNQHQLRHQPVTTGYQLSDTMKSLTLKSDVDVTDSLCPVELGSLQQRIDDVKLGEDRMLKAGGRQRVTQSVSDTLNERVRNILADEEEEEDATSRQVSSIASRSQSRTSSVDYRNLEKDLDEIQSNLESLKGDVSSTRRSSDVSERSAELMKFIEHKGEDDETLKRTRAVLEEQQQHEEHFYTEEDHSPRFESQRVYSSSGGQRRLEPEGHGRSPVHTTATRLPLSPILTSGVIPMDVALDMIHGDPYSSKYNNNSGYRMSPGAHSAYSNRTIDTETLLKDAGYQDGYSDPVSRDDSGQGVWLQGNDAAMAGVLPSKMESLTDREVREINGVGDDTTLDSFSENKTGMAAEMQSGNQDPSSYRTQRDEGLSGESLALQKQDEKSISLSKAQLKQASENVALDISTGSPLTAKPFSACGNMHHLLESHMNKFTASQFEESVEMRSPLKREMDRWEEGGESRSKIDRWEKEGESRSKYGDVMGERREDLSRNVRTTDYGTTSSARTGLKEDFRASPTGVAVTTERLSSPHGRVSISPRDGASSRTSSHGSRGSLTNNLRPYKPPGSREFYYVETGGDALDGMSETTVESTHPGSDDAVGPSLPAQAYGTRNDPQRVGLVLYSKEQALGTIQEQSMVQESADAERHSVESSKPSRASRSDTPKLAGSSSSGYREQSVNKAHNWVNGHWPSKEDVSATPKLGDNTGNRRSELEREQRDRNRKEEASYRSRSNYDVRGREQDEDADAAKVEVYLSGKSKDGGQLSRHGYDDESHGGRVPAAAVDSGMMMGRGGAGVGHREQQERNALLQRQKNDWEEVRVEPYDEYSRKCKNLQSRYKDLKARAEEAIDKLIHSESEDESLRMDSYERKTEERILRESSKKKAEFATPNKLGSSRLSLERSLDDTSRDTSRLSLGGDTGRKSSGDVSRASSAASSRESSHEFMKYHPASATRDAAPDKPSNYRGPAYWNNVVQQNYSEMSKPKAGEEGSGQRVSHDQEIRTIQRLEQERAARLSTGRQSPVGMGRSEHNHTPDIFQPLEPDQDEEFSPLKPRKSHSQLTRSTSPQHRSPDKRSGSPYGVRSGSPYERSGSPYGRSGSPYGRSGSPYGRSGSPYGRSHHERGQLPLDRLDNEIHYRVKDMDGQTRAQEEEFVSDRRSRSPRGHSTIHEWRSPENRYERSKSPFYERSRSPVGEGHPGRRTRSPDVQDMWERFQVLQADSTSTPVNIDLDKLGSLLQNPVQHMVKQMQHGTVFEKDEKRPLRVNQSRTEVTGSETRQSTGNTGREERGVRREERGTPQGQRSSEGHRNRREDDRDDRRRGNGDDGRKKKTMDYADMTDDSEEIQLDETEEEGEKDSEPQKRKMAWVIKDEELHSIPENSTLDSISSDFTTSSEMDSDGKIVTKTTKRNLPGDPKLLRLQQKITKQKEKYKRELSREQKRKDKISKLETLFKEEKAAAKNRVSRDEKTADSSAITTTTCKTTSTPSSERYRHDDTTLGVSNITSSSTLTQGTVVSEDLTMVTSEASPTLKKNRVEEEEQAASDNSSVCHCCHKRKQPSRSVSPPKHPAMKRNTTAHHSHSASPARRERKSKERQAQRVTEPKELKLREVDYNKMEADGKRERQSRKAVYLEIETTPQSNSVPKTKKKASISPSKRKEKENNENLKIRRHEDAEPTRSNQWSRSSTRRQRDLEPERSDMGVQITPKAKSRDFGATCPTPLVVSPAVEREVRKVTMVSAAIQTELEAKASHQRSCKGSETKQGRCRDHHSSPGMFTPEQSDTDVSMTTAIRKSQHKRPVKAAQEGVSWFVPMKEPKPWRKPLRERQANAIAMETWPQMDEFTRRKLEELTLGVDHRNKSLDLAGLEGKKEQGSLQSQFEKQMDGFISASRERQKHIALRAEERKISEIHRSERAILFRVDKKREANLDAMPISEMHYKPRKRCMTKQEMREFTKKKYAKLPEVTQKQEDKKREEASKTNRLRAQMFRQRVQSKVLQKRTPSLDLP